MTIPVDPIERRILAGEYVLGVLDDEQTAEVARWVAQDSEAATLALEWENHFLALADRLRPVEPSASVWARLAKTVEPESPAFKPRPDVATPGFLQRLWSSAVVWRCVSAGFAAAVVVLAVAPQLRTPQVNAPRVAVLQVPGQSAQPGWVVSVLDDGDVQIKGLAALPTPEGHSIQIWTLAPGEKKPRSMGLLADRQTVRLPADLVGTVQPGQLFEFTLEQAGGSPTGLPTGPVLYIGRIVAAML